MPCLDVTSNRAPKWYFSLSGCGAFVPTFYMSHYLSARYYIVLSGEASVSTSTQPLDTGPRLLFKGSPFRPSYCNTHSSRSANCQYTRWNRYRYDLVAQACRFSARPGPGINRCGLKSFLSMTHNKTPLPRSLYTHCSSGTFVV